MNFCDKLKEIRKKEGLSQEELAAKIGVSRQAITKWETGKGMPDIENMIILAEIFKTTLDDLLFQQAGQKKQEQTVYQSETVYDIDCHKHFDIRLGYVRKIIVCGGTDEKIHVELSSETLEEIGNVFKVKLDENKNKLDITCESKQEISNYQLGNALDVKIQLPRQYSNHCELSVSAGEAVIENIQVQRLEYDGDAKQVYIKDCTGSLEFTSKTDCSFQLDGLMGRLDIYQLKANAMVHILENSDFFVVNKGRKCSISCQKGEELCPLPQNEGGKTEICVSGVKSELVIDLQSP